MEINGTSIGSYCLVSSPVTDGQASLSGLTVGTYVQFAGSLTSSSVLLNGTTVKGSGNNALVVTSIFTSSLLHVDNCSLTSSSTHVVQMSANAGLGSVHRFTNSNLTSTYGSTTSSGYPPYQGVLSYMNTFTVNTGGLLHVSNNVFSTRVATSHVLYAISKGGQIIHDDLNRCETTGTFTVIMQDAGPPHVLQLNGYTGLYSVAITHVSSAAMDGLSIELTAGKAAYVVVGMGLSTNANVLISGFSITSYMNVGWGTCTNCSVALVGISVGSSMTLSGTTLIGSNITVAGVNVELHDDGCQLVHVCAA